MIDAEVLLVLTLQNLWRLLTFEELLACIFLEKRIMLDRLVEVVEHQHEDRLYLLFRVAGIMGKSRILLKSVKVSI